MIWDFAGRISLIVGFLVRWLIQDGTAMDMLLLDIPCFTSNSVLFRSASQTVGGTTSFFYPQFCIEMNYWRSLTFPRSLLMASLLFNIDVYRHWERVSIDCMQFLIFHWHWGAGGYPRSFCTDDVAVVVIGLWNRIQESGWEGGRNGLLCLQRVVGKGHISISSVSGLQFILYFSSA